MSNITNDGLCGWRIFVRKLRDFSGAALKEINNYCACRFGDLVFLVGDGFKFDSLRGSSLVLTLSPLHLHGHYVISGNTL